MAEIHSQLLSRAIDELATLPGVGRRTAMRLTLHLLRRDTAEVDAFAEAITNLRHNVRYCSLCHNISDTELCPICANPRRDTGTICVVESVRDVMAIENTQQYNGLYHVLGGVISPMDGIGPGDIEIDSLCQRVANGGTEEVIMALNPTMEGDTTAFFIQRRLRDSGVKVSAIARGISVGDDIEYADELTLGRAILNRVEMK